MQKTFLFIPKKGKETYEALTEDGKQTFTFNRAISIVRGAPDEKQAVETVAIQGIAHLADELDDDAFEKEREEAHKHIRETYNIIETKSDIQVISDAAEYPYKYMDLDNLIETELNS